MWIGGALRIALVAVGAIYLGYQQSSPVAEVLPAEISIDQAYQIYQMGAFVLDVAHTRGIGFISCSWDYIDPTGRIAQQG